VERVDRMGLTAGMAWHCQWQGSRDENEEADGVGVPIGWR
jgi:hypothetical protein